MEPEPGRIRFALAAVIAVTAGLLALSSSVPLIDPDESRFARTSVEMMRTQDMVVPQFEGRPRLVKPPLMHWIQSNLFRLLGPGERVARLHSALATLGSVLLVGWVARRRFGDEAGVWAAAVLATMPLVVVVGHLGTLDALLAVHVFAVVALDMAGPRDASTYRPLAIGGLLGLAFLAKGPVGVVLPLLMMLAGRTAAGREVVHSLRALLQATAAWCAVVLPWGLVFLKRIGGASVGETLRTQVLEAYFSGNGHVEPAYFYLLVVAVGFLPWLVPLALGLWRAAVERRQGAASTAIYAGAALLVGLVFFSLGRNKLPSYILPLAPLAAIVVTWELGQEMQRSVARRRAMILLGATLGLFAAVLALAGALRLEDEPRGVAIAGSVIYGLGAIFAITAALRDRCRWVYGAAAATSALFLALLIGVLFPAIAVTRSSAHLVRDVPELSEPRPLVTVDMKLPGLTFYLDRIPQEVAIVDLGPRLAREDDPLFVFDLDDLAATGPGTLDRLREVGRQGKYVVYEKGR